MATKLTDKQKSMLGSAATGLSSGIGLGTSLAQIDDTSGQETLIEGVGNTQFNAGDTNTLMASFDANNMARTNYTADEIRGFTDGQLAGNILASTATGALSGAMKGGWVGALLEGGSNLIGGTIGALAGNAKAQKRAAELNSLAEENNRLYLNNFANAASNTQNKMFNSSLLNIAAYGGPLFNHGGDWSNGLTFINEGGLHEDNPLGGVPVGVDQEGTPNLVEEGEIIWNDYVFSNRLKPTKKQLELAGFDPKYEGYTFAKIVEDVQKVSAENPLDKISTDTLNENLMYLMTMQEEIRMKKEAKKNKFDLGGPTDSTAVAIRDLANQIVEEQYYKHLGYPNAEVGKRIKKEQKYTKAINSLFERLPIEITLESILSKFSKKEKATGRNKKESNKFPDGGGLYDGMFTVYGNNGKPIYLPTAESLIKKHNLDSDEDVLSTISDIVIEQPVEEDDINIEDFLGTDKTIAKEKSTNPFVNAGTIAPLISSAGQLIYNTLKPIDKSNVIAAKAYSKVPMMSLPRIGGKKSFKPTDKNQYIAPIIAQGNSTARLLQNSGVNASQTLGSLIASNYNTQKAISEALSTIDQADFAKEMQVGQFNLGIDQANLSASQAEQNANIIRANKLAEAELKDAQTLEALGQLKGQAINTSLNTLTKGIADLATQNINWNLIKDNPAYADAFKHLYGKQAKCGGMLTRKKKK